MVIALSAMASAYDLIKSSQLKETEHFTRRHQKKVAKIVRMHYHDMSKVAVIQRPFFFAKPCS